MDNVCATSGVSLAICSVKKAPPDRLFDKTHSNGVQVFSRTRGNCVGSFLMESEKTNRGAQLVEQADVVSIVDLLAYVGDPTSEMDSATRKRALADGLSKLVNGDTYFWNVGFANP